ncbi:MAG: hypothetical protein LRY55_06760 [Leadbetterella sp.]|nr:hypothetical protein [Leadbetterella sp.]
MNFYSRPFIHYQLPTVSGLLSNVTRRSPQTQTMRGFNEDTAFPVGVGNEGSREFRNKPGIFRENAGKSTYFTQGTGVVFGRPGGVRILVQKNTMH